MQIKNYDIDDENRCKFCGKTAVKIDDDGEITCSDEHFFAEDNYTSNNYPNDEIEDLIEGFIKIGSISIANILDKIKVDYQTIVIHNNDDDDLTFDTYIYLVENVNETSKLLANYIIQIDKWNPTKPNNDKS